MEEKKTNVLLLIDGNALIHRFFHALPPLTTPKGEPIGAIYGLANILLKILRDPSTSSWQGKLTYIAACLDRPEPTFRDELFREYKTQRPATADELVGQIIRMREVFEMFGISVFEKPSFEADDLIGTLAERFRKERVRVVALSGDNDLLQLVDDKNDIAVQIIKSGLAEAKVYDEAAVKEKYGLSPDQLADYKGLVGDASDNIPGLKGVGPKTAVPLLREFGSIEGIYENEGLILEKNFKKFKGQKDAALLFKKIATVRRDVPIGEISLKDLEVKPLNKEELAKYFRELGSQSLVNRLNEQ